jgi:branched-chain amino acid transport system substrate-binding protein
MVVSAESAAADHGRSALASLVGASAVHAVIGPVLSSDLAALAPAAEANHTLLLGASTSALGVPRVGEWVRRIAPPVDVLARGVIVAMLAARPSTRAVVVAPSDDPGLAQVAHAYRVALSSEGIEVIPLTATFVRAQTNVDSVAEAIVAVNPDLVVVVGASADAGLLVRSLRSRDGRSAVLADSTAAASPFATVCGPLCDGTFSPVLYDSEDFSTFARATLLKRYHDLYATSPTRAAAQGFAALQVLAIALDAAVASDGSATLVQRRNALRATLVRGRYDTPIGLLSFDDDGEVKVTPVAVGMIRIVGSGPARLVPVTTTIPPPRPTS